MNEAVKHPLERALVSPGPYPVGLGAVLATVSMLFVAFTSALLVRRTGSDWAPVELPAILWANTAFLVVSSAAVELARTALRRSDSRRATLWLAIAGGLGLLFLVGQVLAWRALAIRGVFLPSNTYAAFFYVLTALHGAHLLGGLAALGVTVRRAAGGAYAATSHAGFTHAAIYWHFMGGVWLWLLAVLMIL